MLHKAREELRRIPAPALRDIEHDLVERAEKVYKARSPAKSASKYKKLLEPSKLKSRKRLRSPSSLLPRISDSRGTGSPLRGSPKISPVRGKSERSNDAKQVEVQREDDESDANTSMELEYQNHCLEPDVLDLAEKVRLASKSLD